MTGVQTCALPIYCFFVFFFKQKTAYEIAYSDWSSDVCSSDLGVPVVRSLMITPQFFSEYLQITYYHSLIEPQIEIGRASCRERV